MKRLLAVFLIGIVVFTSACSRKTDNTESTKANSSALPSYNEAGSESTDSTIAPNSPVPKDETVEEQVLLDEAGIKITLKSLDKDNFFGPELKMLFENNSGKDITVQARNLSVNGYMVSDLMSVDIANGKKANDGLTIMSSDLEAAGITTIADLEFSFHIFDPLSWETILDSALVEVKTSAYDGFNYASDEQGTAVYEDGNMKIVVKGLSNDSILGPSVVVYIENKGQTGFTVQARDCSVNGFMMDPFFSADVNAGKKCIDTITFLSDNLEKNGIEEIKEVELSFHVFDTGSWETIIDTDPITLTF